MSNPVLAISQAVTGYVGPAIAPIIGVIGTGVGMVMIVLAGIATARWMEVRHEK